MMSLSEIDTSLFFMINRGLQNPLFDSVMPFITDHVKAAFILIGIFLCAKGRWKAAPVLLTCLFAAALADSSGNLLKSFFARPRPFSALQGVHLIIGAGPSFSLPSNHSSNAFALAAAFWLMRERAVGLFALFTAAVIGFSRVYVGVHYPFDVVAGAVIGVGSAYVAVAVYDCARRIYRTQSYAEALALIIVILSFFRIYLILTGPFDLSPDEAHYWEWSRRLDLSYYSKGPLIAFLIRTGTAVFGNNAFGVRIFAVLLSALSSLLMYRLGARIFDERTGFFSSLLVQVVPLYSVFGMIFTIDSPFIFFWILSLYLFWKALDRGVFGAAVPGKNADSAMPYWALLGVAVGLGLLAKYTMALFYLSAFLFMIFQRDARKLFRQTGPYVAFIISLLVFSPVVIWNARNGWVTLRHTAGQAHVADGLTFSARNLLEFLGSQIGLVTPILAVMMAIALWKMRRSREGSFLFWFSVPMIAFFTLKSVQGKVQANWALAGYASGFLAIAAYYLGSAGANTMKIKRVVYSGFLLAFAVSLVAHMSSVPGLPFDKNPSKKLMGWRELGAEASAVYSGISASDGAFVFSDSYQVASELAFYMKGNPVTYCVNLGRRMNQYDLWPGFEGLVGRNAVFVTWDDQELPEPLASAFSRHEKAPLVIKMGNGGTVKFTLFKCYDFRGMKTRPAESY